MKKLFLLAILIASLAGCAATPPTANYPSTSQDANGVPIDPTYPGPGARIGVGIGSWGGRGFGGIGFGLGW